MTQRVIRILLADDDDLIRLSIAAVCSSIDNVELIGEAADGEDLLKQFERLRPHVVLLDISMPKLTGLDVLGKLKSTDPAVAVVMLTANSDVATVKQCIASGAAGYILKSNPPDEIRATIREVCANKRRELAGAADLFR